MFCGKCGAKVDNDMSFCPECGAQVKRQEQSQAYPTTDYPVQKTSNVSIMEKATTAVKSFMAQKNSKYIIAGVLAALLIAIIVIVIPKGGKHRSYEDVALAYVDSLMVDCDANEFIDLFHEDYIDALLDEVGTDSKEDLVEVLDSYFSAIKPALKLAYGKDFKITREVTGTETYSRSDIRDTVDDLEYDFNIHFSASDISDMKNVTVKYTITGDEKEDSGTFNLDIANINDEWYILELDIDDLGSFGY